MDKNEKVYLYPVSSKKYLDEDGGYDLLEPHNYDEYLALIESGSATERHHDEFNFRMLLYFSSCVYNNMQPDKWVMLAISDIFIKILNGGRWDDEIPLPWSDVSSPFSPAKRKDLSIFCDIANAYRADNSQSITTLIQQAAEKYNVSFEKARAAYYENKHLIKE